MNYDEYRVGERDRYIDLVEAIRSILAAALKAHNMTPHAITGRAKDPVSLENKLASRGIDLTSAIDEQIKDLAGCRVVFLTNAKVQAFLQSGILHDNFDVIDVNVHHAVPGTTSETQLFDSTNYLVQLKSERLALPEYKPFDGMKAEIQVQTLLNHAWAEMGHDTIYKEPEFAHVDNAELEAIQTRMDTVMREHLLPAGHDFDKIARDFGMLVRAERDFAPTLEAIRNSKDNNELADAVGTLDDIVLPRVADRCSQFLDILPALIDAVERTRGSQSEPVETIFGKYAGASGEDVARKVSTVLCDHRYCDPRLMIDTLVRLFTAANSNDERRVWLDLASRFAKHDVDVWKQCGPAVDRMIIDAFANLEKKEAERAQELGLEMITKVLSAEIGGTSRGDFNSIVFHQGSVGASDDLRRIWSDAIDLLEKMLEAATDDAARGEILTTMHQAMRPPYHGGSEGLRTLVMENAARVARIEREMARRCGLEVRRKMETNALHVHHWFGDLPAEMKKNEDLVGAQQRVVGDLLALRDSLNADPDFVLYKTLIGYDSVRPGAWDGDHFDPSATDDWRIETYPKLLDTIDDKNADEWLEQMRRYLGEPSGSGSHAPMRAFAKMLAEQKPAIAIGYLYKMDDDLASILIPLVTGLEAAGEQDAVRLFVERWIGTDRFLWEIVDWLARHDAPDLDLLVKVAARARELANDQAVLSSADAAARIYAKSADPKLIDDVFMPAVRYCAELKLDGWIRFVWATTQGSLVSALDENQAQLLLLSFVDEPTIDFDEERVIAVLTERFPALVFDFFESRIKRERHEDGLQFDPIPFQINDLKGPLANHLEQLLAAARRWYELEPLYHQYRGGRLVRNVFPDLSEQLAEGLRELVKKGDRQDLEFVLATLQPYEGVEQVYPLCMDVVDRLDEGDEILSRVSRVLGEKGVLTGEFGHVQAEGEQHARLEQWANDKRPKVKSFVEAEMRRARKSMAWEQRRAEQDVEQRKRDWGK